jgi:hypothetical protein
MSLSTLFRRHGKETKPTTSEVSAPRSPDQALKEVLKGAVAGVFVPSPDVAAGKRILEEAMGRQFGWNELYEPVVPGVARRVAKFGTIGSGFYAYRIRIDKETGETPEGIIKNIHQKILDVIKDPTGHVPDAYGAIYVGIDNGITHTSFAGNYDGSITTVRSQRSQGPPYIEISFYGMCDKDMFIKTVKVAEPVFQSERVKYEDQNAVLTK